MSNNSVKKEKNQPISVYVRVRPPNKNEINIIDIRGKEMTVKNNTVEKYHKSFVFDKIFGPESEQIEVFKTVAEPAVAEIIAGYNCTIFAYGQTGTGKTYTMAGGNENNFTEFTSWREDKESGIIPRTLSYLFDELRVQQIEYTVRVSYLELYNEEIFDLLSPPEDTTKLKLYDDVQRKGSVIVQGQTEISVSSKSEVYKILEAGAEKRRTATTLMNAQSSRSHTIFSVTVHTKESSVDGEDLLKTGKLNLVDLAGSENINKSGTDKRARETSMINTSLLTLGRCIVALTEHRGHIPYRESKLTRLLRDSLGGRTKTSLIATVSPVLTNLEETLNTLDYASRAKHITNKPEMNQRLTKNALIKDYEEQIMKLQKDLQASRLGCGVYIDSQNYAEMIKEMTLQKQEISDKINAIRALKEEMDEKEKICNELKMEVQQKIEIVETKTKQIEHLESKLDEASSEITNLQVEKEFVVTKFSEKEKVLHNTATKLLTVVKTSTQDNEKLHTKLDVIADLNKYNKKLYEQYINEFNNKVGLIQNRSSNFYSTQNKFHKYLIEITNDIKMKQGELNSACLHLIDKYSEFKSSLEQQENSLSDKQNKLETTMTSAKDTSDKLTDDNKTEIQNIYDSDFVPNFEEILRNIQNRIELNENMMSNIQQIINEHIGSIEWKIKEFRQDIADVKEQILNKIENADSFLSKAKTYTLSSLMDEQKLQDKINEDLIKINNYTANIQALLTQRRYVREMNCEKAMNNYSMLASELNKCETDVGLMVKNVSEHTGHIADNLSYTNDEVDALMKGIEHKNKELTSIEKSTSDKFDTMMQTFVTCTKTMCDKQNNVLSSAMDQVQKDSNEMVSETNQFMQDFVSKLEEQSSEHGRINEESGQFYNNICSKVQSEAQNNNENCVQYESHLNIELDDCRENFKKLFTTYVKEYVPTGCTPLRKKHKYPKNVPPVTNSDELLEDFRKTKYQITEVNDENQCDKEDEVENVEYKDSENQDPNISDKIDEKISPIKFEDENDENDSVSKKQKIFKSNSSSNINSNIPLRQK